MVGGREVDLGSGRFQRCKYSLETGEYLWLYLGWLFHLQGWEAAPLEGKMKSAPGRDWQGGGGRF